MSGQRAVGGTRVATAAWRELFGVQSMLLRRFEAAGDFGELSPREYDVLLVPAEAGEGLRLGDMASRTFLPQPSMSRIVERMERRGLLERCSSPQDARGVLVSLTPAGAQTQREAGRRHVRSISQAMTAGLDEHELQMLTHLLTKVRLANTDENTNARLSTSARLSVRTQEKR